LTPDDMRFPLEASQAGSQSKPKAQSEGSARW
jgi:hypothetical protein